MTTGDVRVVDLQELTAREIQELAAAAGGAMVTKNGKTAFCNARNIPDGWQTAQDALK